MFPEKTIYKKLKPDFYEKTEKIQLSPTKMFT